MNEKGVISVAGRFGRYLTECATGLSASGTKATPIEARDLVEILKSFRIVIFDFQGTLVFDDKIVEPIAEIACELGKTDTKTLVVSNSEESGASMKDRFPFLSLFSDTITAADVAPREAEDYLINPDWLVPKKNYSKLQAGYFKRDTAFTKFVGKPASAFFSVRIPRLIDKDQSVAVIGDTIYTDIFFARRIGAVGILVRRSGLPRPDNELAAKLGIGPDYVIDLAKP